MTVWPMRYGDVAPAASPSTMTTLPSSSMPAEADARDECSAKSASTA
jgi:hypothetical protein